jgi:hypothetical protein
MAVNWKNGEKEATYKWGEKTANLCNFGKGVRLFPKGVCLFPKGVRLFPKGVRLFPKGVCLFPKMVSA